MLRFRCGLPDRRLQKSKKSTRPSWASGWIGGWKRGKKSKLAFVLLQYIWLKLPNEPPFQHVRLDVSPRRDPGGCHRFCKTADRSRGMGEGARQRQGSETQDRTDCYRGQGDRGVAGEHQVETDAISSIAKRRCCHAFQHE